MPNEDRNAPEEITWSGKWIVAKRRGRWEYVSRAKGIRAAVILPIDGEHVILVEQYRVPVGARCLELPAGLIGDEEGGEDEVAVDAARRELEEETGYRAENWEDLGEFQTSPGLTGESFTLLRATGLTKVGPGGGTPEEDIAVHRVRLTDIARVLREFRKGDVRIDARLLTLLGPSLLQDGA